MDTDKTRNTRKGKVKKMNTIIEYDLEKDAQDREREGAIISSILQIAVYGEKLDYLRHNWNAWYKDATAPNLERKYRNYDDMIRKELYNFWSKRERGEV